MQHDVGKVTISDAIIKKPGKLNDEEFHIMKYYTVFGTQLFNQTTSEVDAAAKAIVLGHHERWDGGGYPGQVADVMVEIRKCSGSQLDPEVVESFLDIYEVIRSIRGCYPKAG